MDNKNGHEVDPARILQGIEVDARQTREALSPDQRLLFSLWGTGWVIAFLAIFFTFAPLGAPLLPRLLGVGIAVIAFVLAIVFSAVHSAKRAAGTKGPSMVEGAIYGNTFTLGMIFAGLLGWRLHASGLDAMGLLAFSLAALCLVVGVLVVAGSLIWNDRTQLIFGAWILLVGLISLAVPAPYNLLAGVLGGLGLIALGLLHGARPALVSGEVVRGGHARA
ncbi:hypothetical protein ACT3UQ_05270 [Glutamicibacter sp. AOP12-B1-11]|uniref:hypothetical protein n=1 Tax=Glutamicibacter sp. AOP12-B1-11 TaxID=3457725 RepID=UPI00403496CD